MEFELFELMGTQGDAFTARQAARHGLDYDEVQARIARGDLVRVRRSVYSTKAHWGRSDEAQRHRIEVAAALLVRGWQPPVPFPLAGAFESARCVWRLPGLDVPPLPPGAAPGSHWKPTEVALVSASRCQRSYRGGVHVHPAALPVEHLALVDGVPFTSLARTAVDLSRQGHWWDAVIVGDAVLRAGVDPEELRRVARFSACWPGGRQAMRMAEFARAEAETALESIARAVCDEQGLPEPELQVRLRGTCGQTYRVDMFFRRFRTIFEPDGFGKYDQPGIDPMEILKREKRREDSLRDAGNEVVRATYDQVTRQPQLVAARLRAAFGRSQRAG
ncbi:MAG: hypothetical protein ACT4QG_13755 [Sporichthyaceae bacterium]